MPSPAAETIAAVASALQPLQVPWYLFGAQAAIVRGVARLTADVDVTVIATDVETSRIVAALEAEGFTLRVPRDDGFVEATRVLPFLHRRIGLPVDVVLAGPGLEEEFADRAEPIEIGGRLIPVATASDLVIMKVISGRPKDLADAETLLAVDPSGIDIEVVRDTLRIVEDALGERLELTQTLDRLLASARR